MSEPASELAWAVRRFLLEECPDERVGEWKPLSGRMALRIDGRLGSFVVLVGDLEGELSGRREDGTNPRALGLNARSLGTNPRARASARPPHAEAGAASASAPTYREFAAHMEAVNAAVEFARSQDEFERLVEVIEEAFLGSPYFVADAEAEEADTMRELDELEDQWHGS